MLSALEYLWLELGLGINNRDLRPDELSFFKELKDDFSVAPDDQEIKTLKQKIKDSIRKDIDFQDNRSAHEILKDNFTDHDTIN